MAQIILVRHGQTLWNKDLRYQGHSDVALSDDGLRQAEFVAERLSKEKLAAIYSSDLSRASITAERIAQHHSLPVVIRPELREVLFGQWEGLNYNAIKEGWSSEIDEFFVHPTRVTIPGGETFHEVQERTSRVIDEIVKTYPDKTVAVVSHGAAIRTILCTALDISLDRIWAFRQDNTAVNIIDYLGAHNVVRLVNDIHHLDGKDFVFPSIQTTHTTKRRF